MTTWTQLGFWSSGSLVGGTSLPISIPGGLVSGDLVYVTAHTLTGIVPNDIDAGFTFWDAGDQLWSAFKIIDGTETIVTWSSTGPTDWAYTLAVFRPNSPAPLTTIVQQWDPFAFGEHGSGLTNGQSVLDDISQACIGDGLVIGSYTTEPSGAGLTNMSMSGGSGTSTSWSTGFRHGAGSMSVIGAADLGDINGTIGTSGGVTAHLLYQVVEFSAPITPPAESVDVLSTIATIDHDLLIGVEEDQHHTKLHTLQSHTGGFLYKTGTSPTITDADFVVPTNGMVAVTYDTDDAITLVWTRFNGTWDAVEAI